MTITILLNLIPVLLAMGLLAATVRFAGRAPAAAHRALPAHDWARQQTTPESDTGAIERW